MMVALAHIVEHTLNQQSHQIHNHQQAHQEPTDNDPRKDPILVPAVHHHSPKNATDNPANSQVSKDENRREPRLPLEQLVTLFHRHEAVNRLKHRNHTGQVPQRGNIDMDDQEEHENDDPGENQQKGVLGINGHNDQNQKTNEDEVVDDHQEEDPQEGDEEALEDLRDGGDGGGVRDRLRGVEGSHSEDHSSS